MPSCPLIFAGIMAAAIVFLGPGAFSVDARLFGRREIIIPPPLGAPNDSFSEAAEKLDNTASSGRGSESAPCEARPEGAKKCG